MANAIIVLVTGVVALTLGGLIGYLIAKGATPATKRARVRAGSPRMAPGASWAAQVETLEGKNAELQRELTRNRAILDTVQRDSVERRAALASLSESLQERSHRIEELEMALAERQLALVGAPERRGPSREFRPTRVVADAARAS